MQGAGKNVPTSDLDLAILLPGAKKPSSEIYMELLLDTQKAIDTERFDLLLLNSASPVIQNEVICNGKVIYARSEKELASFEIKVRQKYLDTAYLKSSLLY